MSSYVEYRSDVGPFFCTVQIQGTSLKSAHAQHVNGLLGQGTRRNDLEGSSEDML